MDWKGKLSHPYPTSSEVKLVCEAFLVMEPLGSDGRTPRHCSDTELEGTQSKSPHARGADMELSASRDPPRIGKPAGGTVSSLSGLTSTSPACVPFVTPGWDRAAPKPSLPSLHKLLSITDTNYHTWASNKPLFAWHKWQIQVVPCSLPTSCCHIYSSRQLQRREREFGEAQNSSDAKWPVEQ